MAKDRDRREAIFLAPQSGNYGLEAIGKNANKINKISNLTGKYGCGRSVTRGPVLFRHRRHLRRGA
jgi:hypothetical protein